MTKIAATDRHKVAARFGQGLSQSDIASEFGVTKGRISQLLKSMGVDTHRAIEKPARKARKVRAKGVGKPGNYKRIVTADQHDLLIAMYKGGATLADVGAHFGITRERVRQIVSALGVDRIEGGIAIRLLKKVPDKVAAARAKSERAEARIRATWDMSLEDYRAHVSEHGSCAASSSPMHKYIEQRKNARMRGIAWQFRFAEWWRVWQESGKWAERGQGRYVMARYGDGDTPYSPETVYICTQSQNSKDSFIVSPHAARFSDRKNNSTGMGRGWTICKRNKSNPYIAQFGGKYLGSFPTPELARAAYLAAVEQNQA